MSYHRMLLSADYLSGSGNKYVRFKKEIEFFGAEAWRLSMVLTM